MIPGIKLRDEMLKIRKEKNFFYSKYFVCKVSKSIDFQVVVLVSKKIGCAVKRNKIRRRIKESLRLALKESNYAQKYKIFIRVQQINFKDLTWENLNKTVNEFVKKLSSIS